MRLDLSNMPQCSASVRVQAHWEPISDSTFNLHNESPQHVELFDMSPRQPIKSYGADTFKVFLPLSSAAVGDIWELDSNGIIPFLRQFHLGATTSLQHGEEGAFACLRALSSDYAEIVFRIHAEFTLSSDAYEEWRRANSLEDDEGKSRFIPSQFAGRLVINLQKGTFRAFSLHLPTRNSNVDINAFNYADMVFVPRMELLATDVDDQGGIAWDNAITVVEAHKRLELKFYKFAEIDWLPIDVAVAQAEATHRPIHAIIVWGALDDESC